jgi:NADH-quinone oxidoreductase subunit J
MIILFFFLLLTVGSALVVLLSKNILYAAFSLLLTFLSLGALYVFAQADFLAVAQLMIYVGGILVLLIFGIMLTQKPQGDQTLKANHILDDSSNRFWGGAIALSVFGVLFLAFKKGNFQANNEGIFEPITNQTTVTKLGVNLMTDSVFAFEFVGILLMMVLLGAAYLVAENRETK